MAALLSTTILFRHGARGPGDSELSAWEPTDPIVTQWEEHELENLCTNGVQQIIELGKWFALRYIGNDRKMISAPKVFFRGSVSDRAVESATDFVVAFNEMAGFECSPLTPMPYTDDADFYFRPWKSNPNSGKIIKLKAQSEQWAAKVEENRANLARICALARIKAEDQENLGKALLSITHLSGEAECELFWPHQKGERKALVSLLSADDLEQMTALSCYVWQERYLNTGIERELGGWIFLDMIQRAFDPNYNIGLFAGHDYTILVLLAAGGLLKTLPGPIEFGSYVVFELWSSSPGEYEDLRSNPASPRRASGMVPLLDELSLEAATATATASTTAPAPAISRSASGSGSGYGSGFTSTSSSEKVSVLEQPARGLGERVLRVVLNHRPFDRSYDPFNPVSTTPSFVSPLPKVRDGRADVLADLSMEQVKDIVDSVVDALTQSGQGLPAQWSAPQFF